MAIPLPEELVDDGVVMFLGNSLEEEVLGAEEMRLLPVVDVDGGFGYPFDDERLFCCGEGVARLSLFDEESFFGKMSVEEMEVNV